MRGLIVLLVFNGAGLLLHEWAGVPLPSNVLGMLLLLTGLLMKLIKLEWVEETATFFTKHMMLFFAPLIAGITVFANQLGEAWLSVVLSVVIGTIATMLITAVAVRLLSATTQTEVPVQSKQSRYAGQKEVRDEHGISQ
ncbi:CidA/LrgA family protein [Paenibacillus sp. MMS18-CY102]|uniref:CidA/LrgA family protein n=1 Tax=Paenibacillus sp. MMS18-CY102 TaxID=2682849 RepID=UPI001365305C|nr:CidA/LrgA family protein [Paenibacillus sp. MMS18-CY102]MWC26617.1 CidA/LrgA family protein [Paenibacillus sp. MMS18-CY102]